MPLPFLVRKRSGRQQRDSLSLPLSAMATSLDLEELTAVRVLGRGAMGTVFLVSSGQQRLALKIVDKATFHTKFEAARRARWEMTVLARLTHPFLPSLLGSFETDEFIGWAIPYCPGGDLNVLRQGQTDRIFSTAAIRFYVAEIVLGIEYLHELGIAYRDLKPENVLIQASGHVMLADFDLSRKLSPRTLDLGEGTVVMAEERMSHRRRLTRLMSMFAVTVEKKQQLKKAKSARVLPVCRRKMAHDDGEKSNSFVGTEEYVSPEVVRGEGHEFAVDWWALGILIYEMMYGKTPFRGANRKETFRNVLSKPPEFIGVVPPMLRDLVSRLLEKDPVHRLGFADGATEIKGHAFFHGICWDSLHGVLRPPFVPLTDDEAEMSTRKCVSIRGYFQKLNSYHRQSQPSLELPSPDPDSRRSVSLAEF